MNTDYIYSYYDNNNRTALGYGLIAALGLHLFIILGLGFDWLSSPSRQNNIEITLVHQISNKTPEQASHIAQANQEAGGEKHHDERFTTNKLAELNDNRWQDAAPITPAAALQQQIIDPTLNPQIGTKGSAPDPRQEQPKPGLSSQSLPTPATTTIASLRARLDQQKAAYSRIPRTKVLTGASAKAADEAAYLRQWIEWVEQVGNENYPEEARRKKIFGDLRLAVALQRDGSVESVQILQSSGQLVLDQAAIRIVRLAAPFMPIPGSISADRVEVIRTWRFIPGNQFATD